MKIPFLYKYDLSIESITDIDERKAAIKDKINECRDVNTDKFVQILIALIFGVIPFFIMSIFVFVFKGYIGNIVYALRRIGEVSFGIAFFVWVLFTNYNRSLRKKYKRLLEKISDNEKEEIKEKVDEDVFENSIKLSYKYLDEYYSQTREQAQKGFYVTVFVAVFGAVLIASGIVIMYMGETEPAYVTCAAGVITEFISSIFFYLYNRTITSMSAYHNKLVLSQNISIALKVADSLPEEDKTKSKNLIIEELLRNVNSYLIAPDNNENDKIWYVSKLENWICKS